MKVKDIAKHYSMASNAVIQVQITAGEVEGLHTFSKKAFGEMLSNNAPIMNRTVGLIKVIDNTFTITAY